MVDAEQARASHADRYYLLDGMRGIAAILVALMHFSSSFGGRHNLIAPHAYSAVDFFFALSGLVIARAYERRLRSGMTFRTFLEVRVVRLYPLFLVGLLLGLGKEIVGLAMHRPEALPPVEVAFAVPFNSVMLPDFSGRIATLNGPSWTLTLELLVNIAFALILYRLSVRSLRVGILLSGVVLLAAILSYGTGDIGWRVATFPGGLARISFGFMVGMMVGRTAPDNARPSALSLLLLLPLLALLLRPPTGVRLAYDLTLDLLLF
ncbi:MAG TPA: acyltransferase, partial [Sphingomonas sp.]|nr:acyltransferase [Sphingomonas sp.]